ncbi:MAG: DUF4411 family protein [Chloroflexi bacterium]|nr:DUF4411 family protein [Chloroflexota bacterium]MCY3582134.1 DUF4411 family protein [Chloroflexota bacterium]MCY3716607.1 DUF4411 family protein [Chloroflexota bacterium]MDE2650981.1 DUF4411 family protein [Chloroflexota bacterium]
MTYVVDTSSFIELFQKYPRSLFPSLWQEFENLIDRDALSSIIQVKQELQREKNGDQASYWAQQPSVRRLFTSPTLEEMVFLSSELASSKFRDAVPQHLRSTNEKADIYLIARARVFDGIVVTEERYKPQGTKIPTICKGFNIDCVNLLGMMQRENWRF